MSIIEFTRPHNVDIAKGRLLLKNIAERLAEKYAGSYTENPSGVSFSAPGVSGTIELTATTVVVRAKLGLLMRPLKSAIEQLFHSEIDQALQAQSGQLGKF